MPPANNDEEADMPPFPGRQILFSTFPVARQTFHLTPHSCAIVNLRPLLPGHTLILPLRPLPLLADLSPPELNDLFQTVVRVQKTLKRVYKAEAFNVSVQDGKVAGQSVPHCHVHVIPRGRGDGGEGDKVFEWLEGEEGDVGGHQREAVEEGKGEEERSVGKWKKDGERKNRSMEEMEREARWLREEMGKDEEEGGWEKL